MVSRKDVWAVGIVLVIATIAALAVYVIIDLAGPEPVVVVTAVPTLPPSATAAVLPSVTAPATPTPPPTGTPSPTPIPHFGPMAFGTGISGDQVLNPGLTFPAGTKEVYAVWSYQNMVDGTPYEVSWILDDSPWSYESLTWDTGQHGSEGQNYAARISEHDADGLPPGNYRLELSMGERLVQAATFVVLGPTPTSLPPTPTPQPDMQAIGRRASESLVMIGWVGGGGYYYLGSGSIVDGSEGLILTNWHVVSDEWGNLMDQGWEAEIHLTMDPDQPPRAVYRARILPEASDFDADLAILRITSLAADASPIQTPLNLPSIPLGNSDQVRRGDRVLLLGFPDYAEGTLSWTEDVVATHTSQWLKSGAEASYGASGGMMLNDRGELIGVITALESIGVEGELTLARPINVATRLIDWARGMQASPPQPIVPPVQEPTGETMVVLAAPTLNLRDAPSLSSRVIGDIPMGTVVDVLGYPEWDGERMWYFVEVPYSGERGWASGVYLASEEVAWTPILFTSNRAGSLDVYSIYADGTGLTRITSAPGDEGDASWSPDGSSIVFTYALNGNSDLYTMDAYGGSWTRLMSGPANDVHPVWSPDGTRIAFVSDRDGDWEIFGLDLSTMAVQQLTFNQAWDSFPSWSPDGTRLVYTSLKTGNYDLFVVDAYSGEDRQLTSSRYSDAHGTWSPVGNEIVYTMVVAEQGNLLREIAVLSVDDPAHPRRVTRSKPKQAVHRYPDWSPDGQWIVFESERDGNKEVYLIPARGGIMANLTEASRSSDTAPSWSR